MATGSNISGMAALALSTAASMARSSLVKRRRLPLSTSVAAAANSSPSPSLR
jgi:hypothetical protein